MTPREISISRGRRRGPPDPEGDLNLPGEKEGTSRPRGRSQSPGGEGGDLQTPREISISRGRRRETS
jgi:hypothetical protein